MMRGIAFITFALLIVVFVYIAREVVRMDDDEDDEDITDYW